MYQFQVIQGPGLKLRTRQLVFEIDFCWDFFVHNRKLTVAFDISMYIKQTEHGELKSTARNLYRYLLLAEQYCTNLNYLNIAWLAKAEPVLIRGTLIHKGRPARTMLNNAH